MFNRLQVGTFPSGVALVSIMIQRRGGVTAKSFDSGTEVRDSNTYSAKKSVVSLVLENFQMRSHDPQKYPPGTPYTECVGCRLRYYPYDMTIVQNFEDVFPGRSYAIDSGR